VLRRAERVGPSPDDGDWLLAYASAQAASRIEAISAKVEASAARVEAAASQGPRTSGRSSMYPPRRGGARATFALALLLFAAVAFGVMRFPATHLPEVLCYVVGVAAGVGASGLIAWMEPYFIKREGRR